MNKPLTMKELTTEERLQVFMLYPNAHILYAEDEWHLSGWDPYGVPSLYLTSTGMSIWPQCDVEGATKIAKCQLILKSLEEITEEDAIEVGYFIIPRPDRNENYNTFAREDAKAWIRGGMKPVMGLNECCSAIDFLRSRNYALPFKGVDLFNAGIAVKQ